MDWDTLELEIINFRKRLHKFPELAGKEKLTATRIVDFARRFHHAEIMTKLGGEGIAVIFEGKAPGKTIMIRCDMDALPIKEPNIIDYASVNSGISHKCGHDGHMAIVSGLIPLLALNKIQCGKVVLLYQPAEETGEGAKKILEDPRFGSIEPDFIFALHNLPGFPLHTVVVKNDVFAASSRGLIIRLRGISSHAAEPEKGITPSLAVAELITKLTGLPRLKTIRDFALLTIIHARIGERAFGTTPGYAELMATLRAFNEDDMHLIQEQALSLIQTIGSKHKLQTEIEWVEEFPATLNDAKCVELLRESAAENQMKLTEISLPFRWSEDFGHFTQKYKGAMFGLGAGIGHPELHQPDYDFPDEIILKGIKLFYSIILKLAT